MRNLRHITMQWCAMGNVVILNNMTNDMNLHGGWEGFNLFELNYVSVPYSHRSGSCASCGGEGGDQEAGTWYPMWWGAGEKASKWSGATGPRNIFYRNYMIKQQVDGGEYIEYRPYFARDGSLSSTIWQMGWDSQSPAGIRYTHLSLENRSPIKDWQSHEQVDFSANPAYGANSALSDPHTSLFLKDVTAANGTVAGFSGIAGNTFCRGDVVPRVTGYYFASASRRPCNPFFPDAIDYDVYTHILFAYGVLARDGTITVASEDQQLLRDVVALKSQDSEIRVFLAVGGWGLGADPANMVAVATSSAARTKLGTSGAALCQSYGLDGIDLEWASGISATQWKNIVQGASAGLRASNFNLSISTPHSFWSSSGINTVAADISKAVDFTSLISHDLPGTTLEYANSLSRMTSSVAAIHKLGFPRSQIMMGVPFYGRSRRLSDPSCTDDGCGVVAGLGSTSECIPASGLGQGTFPYFSTHSRITNTNLDIDSFGKAKPIADSAGRFVTDSGYVFDYETPESVVEKAREATMLCLGGLSVFAIDQDNRNFDLTSAIWSGGALAPTAAEIVSTIEGEPLNSDGLVSSEFWDTAADQILEYYPNLSMVMNYQVMILLAIRALDAVASSLFEYLRFSALSEDSFQLYKKWETKSLNWVLANETGKGNDFWECSYTPDSNFAHETCPGGHNTRGADVNDIYWRLTDPAGFSNYLTEGLGFDTSELIIGNIYVGRNPSTCISLPRPRQLLTNSTNVTTLELHYDDAIPETNQTVVANTYLFEDDGTGRIRRIPTALTARHHIDSMPPYDPTENSEGFSPYDPDKDCRTQWHDVLLIDADKFFPNVKDGIQAFLDQYEDFKISAIQVTSDPFETVESLGPILQLALTTLVSGNDTLYSTMQYIEQVKYDKALQEQYDALEEQARQAAIQLIVDLVLTLLSFVPLGALVSGAARAARALLPVFRSARATRSFARGLEKALDGAMDAKNVRSTDELLSPTALEGRGRIGRALNRVQESCFDCGGADYVGGVLDFLSFAEPFVPTDGLVRRMRGDNTESLDSKPSHAGVLPLTHHRDHLLEPRAVADAYPYDPKTCIWHPGFSAKNLKSDGDIYKLGCHANSAAYPMKWLDPRDGNQVKTITYTDCRPRPDSGSAVNVHPDWKDASSQKRINAPNMPLNPRDCQCDHMFEAVEVREAFRTTFNEYTKKMKPADRNALSKDLCTKPEYKTFFDSLRETLNSDANMRPLYGQPNTYKSSWIRADMLPDSSTAWPKWVTAARDPTSEKHQNIMILDEYMEKATSDRVAIARELDKVIQTKLLFTDPNLAQAVASMKLGQRDVIDDNNTPQKMGLLEETNRVNVRRYEDKFVRSKFKSTPSRADLSGAPASDKVINKKHDLDDSGSTDPDGSGTTNPDPNDPDPPRKKCKTVSKATRTGLRSQAKTSD